jgi:putative oxidoreductase
MRRQLYGSLWLAARAMLTATFILSALRHLTHWSAALDEMVGDGMPRSSILLLGSITFRLLGGLSVLVGFRGRIGAALLVLFILPAAFLAHDFWAMPTERQTHEMIEFLNNLAIAGGALLVALNGPGPWSIDSIPNKPASLAQ